MWRDRQTLDSGRLTYVCRNPGRFLSFRLSLFILPDSVLQDVEINGKKEELDVHFRNCIEKGRVGEEDYNVAEEPRYRPRHFSFEHLVSQDVLPVFLYLEDVERASEVEQEDQQEAEERDPRYPLQQTQI